MLGSDEIASAIAHRLHCERFAVVLIDRVDPPVARRGMAFADAWYVGTAELSGVHGVFCASLRSIPSVLREGASIAATTWSWRGVAEALAPVVTIETRAPSRRTKLDGAIAPAMRTIELVPGAVCAPEFHVALPGPTHPTRHARTPLYAPHGGRFATPLAIGGRVHVRDRIAAIDTSPVLATATGVLRGLAARGARVSAGDLIGEIDGRAESPECFGLDAEATRVADAVMMAVLEHSHRLPAHDRAPR